MPDPKGFVQSICNSLTGGASAGEEQCTPHEQDDLDTQSSAQNLRRNMHKVLSSRQRQLEHERPASCPGDHVTGSDADSARSSQSSQNPNPTLKAFHERQVSAPADVSAPSHPVAPPTLPPKHAPIGGSTENLTGSGRLTISQSVERTSSIVPIPGPIPQPAIAGNGDKLSPRVFAGFNLGLGMPKKNPLPVAMPTVPFSSRPQKDADGFLRPRTPAGVKPPLPERRPINSRGNQRTPLVPPRVAYVERPKSTPPSLQPTTQPDHRHQDEDTEYDSDPGNLGNLGNLSSMSATMSLETTLGGAHVNNLSVTGLGDQWAVTGDQWGKPIAEIETPKEKRRFSEGFFLFNKVRSELIFRPLEAESGDGPMEFALVFLVVVVEDPQPPP